MKHILSIVCLVGLCMAQELRRPTIDSDAGNNLNLGCTGIDRASSSMPFSYDAAGIPTSSKMVENGNRFNLQQYFRTRKFTAWQPAGNTYPTLQLNVNRSSIAPDPSQGDGQSCISYSLNSGSTWTTLTCDETSVQQTVTATLPAAQNLSTLLVGICTQYAQTDPSLPGGSETLVVYDIWTVGTTTGGGAGTGSSNGQAHRAIVAVN